MFERKYALSDYLNVVQIICNSFINLLFTFKSYMNKEKKHDIIRLSINYSNC